LVVQKLDNAMDDAHPYVEYDAPYADDALASPLNSSGVVPDVTKGGHSTCDRFTAEIVQLKWRALVPVCMMCVGSYYIYDMPGSIGMGHHHSIEARFLAAGKEYTQEMNQALYSVYSWPNTVLAVFGGLLIDKYIGLRKSMMLFAVLVFVGAIVFYFGVLSNTYSLLIVGRIIFGLGAESLNCTQTTAAARWFHNGGLAVSICMTISFSRVGASLGFLLSPRIAQSASVPQAALVGIFMCLFSLILTGGAIAMDVFATRRRILPAESLDSNAAVRVVDAFKFKKAYWLLCGFCCGAYCSIYPFIAIAKNFFEVNYGVSSTTAGSYLSAYQIMCAIGLPLTGFLVEFVGRFPYFLVFGGVFFTLFQLLFLLALPPPIMMMAMLAVTYCLAVPALWPAIPVVVPAGLVGLANGVMIAVQNTGLATLPLISGAILDAHTEEQLPLCSTLLTNTSNATAAAMRCTQTVSAPLPTSDGYRFTSALFAMSAGVGLAFACAVLIHDRTVSDGLLCAAPERRQAMLAAAASAKKLSVQDEQELGLISDE
jgi:MFS family permease